MKKYMMYGLILFVICSMNVDIPQDISMEISILSPRLMMESSESEAPVCQKTKDENEMLDLMKKTFSQENIEIVKVDTSLSQGGMSFVRVVTVLQNNVKKKYLVKSVADNIRPEIAEKQKKSLQGEMSVLQEIEKIQDVEEGKSYLNVPKVFSHFAKGNGEFKSNNEPELIVMEYIEGDNLSVFMNKEKYKDFPQKIQLLIFSEIFQQIIELHVLGYAHRDIKPENIIIKEENSTFTVTLVDFGLSAKVAEVPKGGTSTVSKNHSYLMSLSKGGIDENAMLSNDILASFSEDSFAFGIILYQMLMEGSNIFANSYHVGAGIEKRQWNFGRYFNARKCFKQKTQDIILGKQTFFNKIKNKMRPSVMLLFEELIGTGFKARIYRKKMLDENEEIANLVKEESNKVLAMEFRQDQLLGDYLKAVLNEESGDVEEIDQQNEDEYVDNEQVNPEYEFQNQVNKSEEQRLPAQEVEQSEVLEEDVTREEENEITLTKKDLIEETNEIALTEKDIINDQESESQEWEVVPLTPQESALLVDITDIPFYERDEWKTMDAGIGENVQLPVNIPVPFSAVTATANVQDPISFAQQQTSAVNALQTQRMAARTGGVEDANIQKQLEESIRKKLLNRQLADALSSFDADSMNEIITILTNAKEQGINLDFKKDDLFLFDLEDYKTFIQWVFKNNLMNAGMQVLGHFYKNQKEIIFEESRLLGAKPIDEIRAEHNLILYQLIVMEKLQLYMLQQYKNALKDKSRKRLRNVQEYYNIISSTTKSKTMKQKLAKRLKVIDFFLYAQDLLKNSSADEVSFLERKLFYALDLFQDEYLVNDVLPDELYTFASQIVKNKNCSLALKQRLQIFLHDNKNKNIRKVVSSYQKIAEQS